MADLRRDAGKGEEEGDVLEILPVQMLFGKRACMCGGYMHGASTTITILIIPVLLLSTESRPQYLSSMISLVAECGSGLITQKSGYS